MKMYFKNISFGGLLILLSLSLLHSEYLRLKNGTNIIFDVDKSASLSAIQIWISVGAVHESKDNSGISHFIEHTIFKGTKTRTQKEIAPEIEKLGGIINAATSKDFTFFYTVLPGSYCLKAVEILSDAVLNPIFAESEVEKERKVILEEIKRKDDNPQSQLFDEFYTQVYSTFCYAQQVIGNEDTVSKLKSNDLLSFHKTFYTPDNIFVVVTGNFEKKEIYNLLKNSFGKLPKTKKQKDDISMLNLKNINESSKKIIKKNVAQTYIIMGFPAANIKSKDQFPLDIASYILGSGRASRLHKKLVEDAKLAFSISSAFSTHRGPGLFYVYAECNPENTAALSNRILLELLDLSINPVSNEELNRAKALLLRDKLLQMETPDGKAEELGFYAALGNKKFSDTYIKKVKKVKPADIKEAISKYLIFPNIPTVIITP